MLISVRDLDSLSDDELSQYCKELADQYYKNPTDTLRKIVNDVLTYYENRVFGEG